MGNGISYVLQICDILHTSNISQKCNPGVYIKGVLFLALSLSPTTCYREDGRSSPLLYNCIYVEILERIK